VYCVVIGRVLQAGSRPALKLYAALDCSLHSRNLPTSNHDRIVPIKFPRRIVPMSVLILLRLCAVSVIASNLPHLSSPGVLLSTNWQTELGGLIVID
jgi:hypothetical protein